MDMEDPASSLSDPSDMLLYFKRLVYLGSSYSDCLIIELTPRNSESSCMIDYLLILLIVCTILILYLISSL